jgi:Trypsin
MPTRTSTGQRWVLASTAALVAAASCCQSAGAVVGGTSVSLTDHPYQVALVKSAKSASTGQFCGGSIRDAWHIITAAHCVWDTSSSLPGQPISASQVDVLAGTEDLRNESAGQRPDVAAISVDPHYDSGVLLHDAALLTLASPLTLGAKEQPIQLVTDAASSSMTPGYLLFATGWGDTTGSGSYPFDVHGASVPFVSDAICKSDYQNNFPPFTMDPATQLCAGDDTRDSCFGDSGGPLVQQNGALAPADDRLVGIVSWGAYGCADADFPGVYTEIAAPSVRSFVTLANPPPAPVNSSAPTLTGAASVGQQLNCAPGAWSGSPSFSYQFVRSNASSVDVGVASDGPASYTVTAADAGTALRCIVTARNDGGTSLATSARTGLVPGVNKNPGKNSLDKNAPVAKVIKTRCTSTRCVLTVTVTDAGYSAGIKTVQSSVTSTYRGTCRKNGRKVRCTKHKTKKLSAKKLATKKFQIVASKLPIGKQLFTLYAVDKASHRQRLPTRKTVRTKRAKKHR